MTGEDEMTIKFIEREIRVEVSRFPTGSVKVYDDEEIVFKGNRSSQTGTAIAFAKGIATERYDDYTPNKI